MRKARAPELFISIFHDLFPDRYQSPFTFAQKQQEMRERAYTAAPGIKECDVHIN
jgi:hypothetical protein